MASRIRSAVQIAPVLGRVLEQQREIAVAEPTQAVSASRSVARTAGGDPTASASTASLCGREPCTTSNQDHRDRAQMASSGGDTGLDSDDEQAFAEEPGDGIGETVDSAVLRRSR